MIDRNSPIYQQLSRQWKRNLGTIENLTSKGLPPQKFCLVPFSNLILDPGGNICVCRHKGTKFIIGNLANNTIEEIWNGPFLKKWRREFLEGRPEICATEMAHQHCQLCPNNNELLDFIELEEVQSGPFLKLTANLNGFCNLKCQMCTVWQLPNGYYTEENFWRPGREGFFSSIKEVDMLSGEPFLQPDTYKLIDEISALNPTCRWSITTNAHWKLNQKIRESLDKIDLKILILSVDSFIPEVYQRIRTPGKLSIVLENIEALLEYRAKHQPETDFHLNFLVQKDNWKEVHHAITYCFERNIYPFLSFLYEPSSYSLLTLPEDQRIEILNHYFTTLSPLELNLLSRVLIPLIQSCHGTDKAHYLLEMANVNQAIQEHFS